MSFPVVTTSIGQFPNRSSCPETSEQCESQAGNQLIPAQLPPIITHDIPSPNPTKPDTTFPPDHFSHVRSLEKLFNVCPDELDLTKNKYGADFFFPNERGINQVQLYLQKGFANGNRDLLVATGTYRCFFDLILCNGLCAGLIIMDINPRVKAYMDFIILLLRISIDREDFTQLFQEENWKQSIPVIKMRLQNHANISGKLKDYYLKNLENFAEIYYQNSLTARALIKDFPFEKEVDFRVNDDAFALLKTYADKGAIVVITDSIEHLNQLGARVAVVDTSNIHWFSPLEFENSNFPKNPPLVIWTHLLNSALASYQSVLTTYHSAVPHSLTRQEKKELDNLINIFDLVKINSPWTRTCCPKIILADVYPGYNIETLRAFQQYRDQYCLNLPHLGWIDFSNDAIFIRSKHREAIQQLSPDQWSEVCHTPGLEHFVNSLAQCWRFSNCCLSKEQFFGFSHLPGWEEAFKSLACSWSLSLFFNNEFYKIDDPFWREKINSWRKIVNMPILPQKT